MKQPRTSANATSAPLLLDVAAAVGMHRFRTTADLSSLPAGLDLAGFGSLRCSASSQFSVAGWNEIVDRAAVSPEQLYVVDLRQEPHGFVDGHAVSWHAHRNWGAVGLTPAESRALEELLLRVLACGDDVEIALGHEVRGGTIAPGERAGPVLRLGSDPARDAYCADHVSLAACPTRDGRTSRDKRTSRLHTETWPVRRAETEQAAVALPDGHYVRIPVTDHLRPTDERLDDFVDFVRQLPDGAHVHFHCRGGQGRTTTFMVLYDLLRNASAVPLESILTRVRLLGRYCLCFVPPEFHRDYVLERWHLLEPFCRFARDEGLAGTRPWSAWLAAQSAGPAR